MPTKTFSAKCNLPSLWMRTHKMVLATVRDVYTSASGDPATRQPSMAKDVTICRGLRLVRCRVPCGRASPPYAEVPFLTSTRYSLVNLPPPLKVRFTKEQVPGINIQGCGEFHVSWNEPHQSRKGDIHPFGNATDAVPTRSVGLSHPTRCSSGGGYGSTFC